MASLWISPPLDVPDAPAPTPSRKPQLRLVHSATGPAVAPPAGSIDLRAVYLRRRIVATVVAVAILALSWQVLSILTGPFAGPPSGADAAAVVVHDAVPGETLWSLAAELGPDEDIRRSLEVLTRLNGGSSLVVGQAVRVPASWYGGAR